LPSGELGGIQNADLAPLLFVPDKCLVAGGSPDDLMHITDWKTYSPVTDATVVLR
jgi:hypothetical protein